MIDLRTALAWVAVVVLLTFLAALIYLVVVDVTFEGS